MRPVILLLPVLAAGAFFAFAKPAPEFPPKLPTFGEQDIAGWTRVNEKKRHRMPVRVAMLCAMPPPEKEWRGAHTEAFTETFVNDLGKAAMFSMPIANLVKPDAPTGIVFPTGSVIIKVKYASVQGSVPLLRTVMIKREKGYNPTCGDWEFVVTDGVGKPVGERGKLQSCMNCHAHEWIQKDDYTYRRDYLPEPLVREIYRQEQPAKQ